MAIKRKGTANKETSLIDFTQIPNSEVFTNELKTLCSAACGVILVRTRELHRCANTVFEFAVSKGDTKFRTWMVTDGWRELPTTRRLPPAVALTEPAPFQIRRPNPWDAMGNADFSEEVTVEQEDSTVEVVFDLYPDEDVVSPDGKYDFGSALEQYFKYMKDDYNGGTNSAASINVMFAPDEFLTLPGPQEYIRRAVSMSLDMDARLVLICHDTVEIPEQLHEEVRVLDFLPPNAAELFTMIEEIVNSSEIDGEDGGELDFTLEDRDRYRIVQNALGLSASEFSTALSIGLVKQDEAIKSGDEIDVEGIIGTILESKLEMVKKMPTLEYLKPVPITDVGGLDVAKAWISEHKRAFSQEAAKFGVDKPRGILAVGIPGSGKSLLAKAVSSVLSIPTIAFDIGKVFGGIVGQSEGQMRASLRAIEAMAPCVLLVDEVDKGFANTSGGGDSGTSARVFGTFLTWLNDRKNDEKPVVTMFTANNVQHLPPELMRQGRIDVIFAVSFPTYDERIEILRIHANKRGHHDVSDEIFAQIARETQKFVGAELEAVIKKSLLKAFNAGESTITAEIGIECARDIKPLAVTFPEKVIAMNEWAKNNAKSASSHTDFNNPEAGLAGPAIVPRKPGSGRTIRPIRPGRSSRN